MFVDNRSNFRPRLNATDLDPDKSAACISLRVAYGITPAGLVLAEALEEPSDSLGVTSLCLGSSWSLRGSVHAQRARVTCQDVIVRAGTRSPVSIRVWGERRWTRTGSGFVPSAPLAWSSLALSAQVAFGGTKKLPPGMVNGLPHPGLTISEPRNPIGLGLQHEEEGALGEALPQIEFVDAPMASPCARPDPAVLWLEQANALLRVPTHARPDEANEVELLLRFLHPAHHRAWGKRLDPGDAVLITGASKAPVAFDLSESPVVVSMRQNRAWKRIGSHVRHVAIDLDRSRVEILYGHSASYSSAKPVTDVRVEARVAS